MPAGSLASAASPENVINLMAETMPPGRTAGRARDPQQPSFQVNERWRRPSQLQPSVPARRREGGADRPCRALP
jgi:hypothetical protein